MSNTNISVEKQIANLNAEIEYIWELMNYWKGHYLKLRKESEKALKIKKKFLKQFADNQGKTICPDCKQPLKGKFHFTNKYGHWSYSLKTGSLTDGVKIEISSKTNTQKGSTI